MLESATVATAPIVVERFGRAYRVHATDEHEDPVKFQLILKGMTAAGIYWTKRGYSKESIPDVLKVIVDAIKGKGYSVILRT